MGSDLGDDGPVFDTDEAGDDHEKADDCPGRNPLTEDQPSRDRGKIGRAHV